MVLILGIQILRLTHSSFWVGAALFLTQGPVILLAPVAGVLADRLDRRALSSASSLLAAVATGGFGLANLLHALTLPLALTLCVVFGASFLFQLTLRSTLVPNLVPAEDLLNGIALTQVGTQGAEFLGPAITTPLVVLGGPALGWALCTLVYLMSALLILPIGPIRATRQLQTLSVKGSYAYLVARPIVLAVIVTVAFHCSLTMSYQGMLPMFVSNDLKMGSGTYGTLLTTIGLGAVIGSLVLARLAAHRYRPAIFVFGAVGSGLSLSLMAVAWSLPVLLSAGLLVGATQAMFMSMALALVQSATDDGHRGRITSVYQLITLTPMAVFGWGMGGLADVVQPRPVMETTGLLFVVALAVLFGVSPWLRHLLRPEGWRRASAAPLADPSAA